MWWVVVDKPRFLRPPQPCSLPKSCPRNHAKRETPCHSTLHLLPGLDSNKSGEPRDPQPPDRKTHSLMGSAGLNVSAAPDIFESDLLVTARVIVRECRLDESEPLDVV